MFYCEQNNLLPNGEQSVDGSTLTIKKAHRHEAGIYVCSGSNGVGSPVDSEIEIRVQCKFSTTDLGNPGKLYLKFVASENVWKQVCIVNFCKHSLII